MNSKKLNVATLKKWIRVHEKLLNDLDIKIKREFTLNP